MKFHLPLFILLFSITTAFGQSFSAKVVDAKTGKPVSFATVQTGEHQGLITNEEGVFTVQLADLRHPQDSVYVSSMGYEKLGWIVAKPADTVIALAPKAFELKQVFVSNTNLDVRDIIDSVKYRMYDNYKMDLSKKKIFFRQSDNNQMHTVDFGFQKSTIAELNKQLIDSIAMLVPRQSYNYKEVAGEFYGNYQNHKLYIDKAAELYDKSKDVSFDGLSDKLERIFKENVKPDSYLKIKSGIFGTKVELDSITEAEEDGAAIKAEVEKQQAPSHFQQGIIDRISELYEQLFFHEGSKLDMFEKSNRYRFTKRDYTFIDNEPVYIIDFEPKGKKDFKGTLYVNTSDFAVVRLEFDNVRPLKRFGLLGIKFRQNVFRGKMLFAKEMDGTYGPRYLELEDGSFFGVDRPLKVIEKNKHVKGRRKQNELSLELKVETSNVIKYELVVFDSEYISQSRYDSAPENPDIKATYLSQYDPSFWQGHTIIEPNAAIQEFRVVE
ncbi:carboxypeptidase-like regulatory domain-containing protein [Aureisphaera galaxeae]|uniref:carboxypeptidase-like regulatory domain-containing protein n=1 Tax=Aureisphaera galaxeae TaxID=1538023 RepID=UPI002350DC2A|nr:carboxypeptidase-like regulatory domain-containing protein [Aureisphaera galaxeae]MDC8005383.1 carboxypeptidase-like regulatory domain-containing protein [Aureisphaera galaxeae]